MKRGTFLRRMLLGLPVAIVAVVKAAPELAEAAEASPVGTSGYLNADSDTNVWVTGTYASNTVSVFVDGAGVWRDHNGRRIQASLTS